MLYMLSLTSRLQWNSTEGFLRDRPLSSTETLQYQDGQFQKHSVSFVCLFLFFFFLIFFIKATRTNSFSADNDGYVILLEFLSQNKALVEELWSGETMLISVSAFRNVIVAQLTNQIVMVINDPFLDQVRLNCDLS